MFTFQHTLPDNKNIAFLNILNDYCYLKHNFGNMLLFVQDALYCILSIPQVKFKK